MAAAPSLARSPLGRLALAPAGWAAPGPPRRRLGEALGPLAPQNGTCWLRRSKRAALAPAAGSERRAQSRT